MASRIVVFPVMGRRWAFSAVLPTGGDQSNSGSSVHGGRGVRELWSTMRAAPRTSDRADLLTNFVSHKMNEKFTEWEVAPDGSIRRRLHRIGQRMLSRLGPTESLLKSIPKNAELMEVVYPNVSLSPRLVRRRLRHLASSGEVIHRRYLYGSIAMLPFSAILGLLPLPNVVLAWNLFRAYSHWRAVQKVYHTSGENLARRCMDIAKLFQRFCQITFPLPCGSRRLYYLVTDSSDQISTLSPGYESEHERDKSTNGDAHLQETGKGDRHLVFLPSEILDSLLVPAKVPINAISDVTVTEICREFPLDPLEILKWRDHRLPIKSFG